MGDVLRIGIFFWLGAATSTVVTMGVYAATNVIRHGQLPEQDIPYWQGLLIYLPAETFPAAVFALTAMVTSAVEIFPLLSLSGSGLVGTIAAGGIYVGAMVIIDQRKNEDQRLLTQKEESDFLRQVEILLRYGEEQLADESQRMLVQEQRPGLLSRLKISIPGLVFSMLPIGLYCCLQVLFPPA